MVYVDELFLENLLSFNTTHVSIPHFEDLSVKYLMTSMNRFKIYYKRTTNS